MTQDPTITRAPEPGAGITHSVVEPITSTGVDAATTSRPTGPASSDRYLLGDEIARGGMGVVYCATDTAFGREVAVKVLLDKYGPASGAARRFADEARITGQLQHPAIPPVHDLGTLPDGRPFLAMKLIKGRTLDELLKDRADLAADRGRFVAAFESVCQAVAYAHAHQVIHRDLKPANVMVGSFGEVQVMDWGLAKVLTTRERERPELDPDETHGATEIQSLRDSEGSFTQAGSVLGTLAFMAPEQAVGAIGQVDLRSDVFGLGAILAVILTGQPPFAASSAETTRVQAAQGHVEGCFARLDASGADPDLVALCKRCLSPKPPDRPADAGRVAAAVGELRAAADERARRAELDRVKAEGEKVAVELQATEQRKRRRVQLMLAAAVAVLLFGGGAAAWWQDRQATAREIARLEKVSEAERKVNLALANADQLAAQSAPFDSEMVAGAESAVGQWRQAEAAVEQAEGVATTAGDRELMRRVAEKAAVIRAGLEGAESAKIRAQRDVEFVAALESAWALLGTTLMVADGSATVGQAYTRALESFGIPTGGTADALATAFRSERKSVRAVLIPALDRWHELAPRENGGTGCARRSISRTPIRSDARFERR